MARRVSFFFVFCVMMAFSAASCSSSSETISRTGNSQTTGSIPAYPQWFLNPDRNGPEAVVGYAPASFFKDEAAARAAESGKKAWRARHGIKLEYTSFWEQHPDDSFRKTGREIITDTLMASTDDELEMLDYAQTGRMTIAAVGQSQQQVSGSQKRQPGPQPNWVRNTPDSDSGFYATGYHAVYYNEHYSWQKAELQALLSLARNYRTEHQRLERTLNGASEATTLQTSSVTIDTYRVVARWRDEFTSYVLIHANVR